MLHIGTTQSSGFGVFVVFFFIALTVCMILVVKLNLKFHFMATLFQILMFFFQQSHKSAKTRVPGCLKLHHSRLYY